MSKNNNNIQLPFTTSHAFIIGINDYEEVSPLSTAVNDAKALAEQLEQQHGYQVHSPLLNATKEEMIHLLHQDLPRLVAKNDRVLFYFAGHGIALDSDDDPKGYLVPVDAQPGDTDTLLSMDVLHKAISRLPCQHGMLIMDCCFAGAFKWSTGFRDVVFDLPGIIYEERFHQYAQDPAWQVITSSASDQKAVDILSDRTLGLRNEKDALHSPFAQALLEGLAGEADTVPKDRGDGVITATELYTYLRNRVEDETMDQGKRQSPSMFSLQKHDKGQYIFLSPNHRLNLPPIPKRNPFMGLKSYNESDDYLFYGRDRAIKALEKLTRNNSLVVVSGASGTGKSSVIKAGLLPLLRKKDWQIFPVIRPGKEPMKSLESKYLDFSILKKNNQLGLLIIDQYEELITQCLYPEKRIQFEEQLEKWLSDNPNLHIAISIRSDFEPQFEKGALGERWQSGRYVVPAFSQDELREVIVKPTVQEVLFFEPDALVDKLVDAVNQAPGALPLLSFTLSELYHAYLKSGRTNRAFTIKDYEKLGGVIGALRTRANEIYDGLDEVHQSSMRKLMIRMVSLEGGELASRRVLSDDLIFSDTDETKRIEKIAQQLVEARLVSSGRDTLGGTYYEPAHDALVRAWGRLWEWIKTLGEGKMGIMYKLSLAVADHQENINSPKAKDYLWNKDPRLDLLYADLGKASFVFNAKEEGFLKESMKLRRKNTQQRKLFTGGAIVIFALMLFSLFQWNNARNQRMEAEKQADLATSESVRANDNAEEAKGQKAIADSLRILAVLEKDTAIVLRYKAETESTRANKNAKIANELQLVAEQARISLADAQDDFMTGLMEDADSNINRVENLQALANLNTIVKIGDEKSGLDFRVAWQANSRKYFYEVIYFFTESRNDASALESLKGYSSLTKKDYTLLENLYTISLYNFSKETKTVDEVKKIRPTCLDLAKYLKKESQYTIFTNDSYSPELKNAVNKFIDEVAEQLPTLKSTALEKIWPEEYTRLAKVYFPEFNSPDRQELSLKRFGMFWAIKGKSKPLIVNWQDAIDYADWVKDSELIEEALAGVTQRSSSSSYWIENGNNNDSIVFMAELPIFYFDNDKPRPRSIRNSTNLTYLQTAEKYLSRRDEYRHQLASEPKELKRIDKFFNELENTIPFLQKEFPENLKTISDAGFKMRFETAGFASYKANSQYDLSLSRRRISALENYIRSYLNQGYQGNMSFVQEPMGESESNFNKSLERDRSRSKKNIYHYDNAVERKVDLIIMVFKEE